MEPENIPPARKIEVSRRAALAGLGGAVAAIAIGVDLAAPIKAFSWGGYNNGQIPLSALSPIVYPGVSPNVFPGSLSQVYMEPNAAAQLLSLLQTYHAQTGGYLPVVEGYRTLAGQQYWWDYWGHDPSHGAYPGTSPHGLGLAVDFNQSTLSSTQRTWLVNNCSAYAFAPYSVEFWHFNYIGSTNGQAAPPPPHLEDLMATGYYLRYTSSSPNKWIAINDVDKTYRIIPPGTFESQRLDTMVVQGILPQVNIADPVWGQTYGAGQFTSIP